MIHAHPVPEAAVAKHIAVLGKTGSGKTFAAKGIVERIARKGGMIVVLDPTGAWWGLGLDQSGTGPSDIRTIVLGGQHGHMPLDPASGAACAELVAHREGRQDLGVVIIDVGSMTVGERTRWAYQFGERLYQLNARPLHLVIDEAHCFAPQGRVPDPESGRLVHAFCQLASGGRSRGVRLLMITQRPAKLHKDALTCADTLIAMRVMAPQDREAIEEWIDGAGDRKASKQVLDSLAQLKTGEGWVWYPDGSVLERSHFPPITTYDSSATPDEGTVRPALPPADLDAIRTALGEALQRAAAEDPSRLRKRIAELEQQLDEARRAPVVQPASIEKQIAEAVEEANNRCAEHDRDHQLAVESVKHELAGLVPLCETIAARISRAWNAISDPWDNPNTPVPLPASVPGSKSYAEPPVRAENGSLESVRARASGPTPRAAASASADRGGRTATPAPTERKLEGLGQSHRKVLDAIAWWDAIGVSTPTRVQVAHVAGYTPSSGTFRNLLSELRTRDLISYLDGSRLCLTSAAFYKDLVTVPEKAGTIAELQSRIIANLGSSQAKVFKVLIAHASITRTHLAETCGYEPASGTFRNLLSELVSLGLARYPNKTTIAAEAWLLGSTAA